MAGPEVIVAGGGPAGAALALTLGRRGRRVLVVERDHLPRHKLCGEFLSPESQALLEGLGCLEALRRHQPERIRRARFTTATGRALELELPGEGLGVSRWVLDALLLEAAAHAGVEVLARTEVASIEPAGAGFRVQLRAARSTAARTIEAPRVVGAHGRRSRLDRALGRGFMEVRQPFVGFAQHHRALGDAATLRGWVELYTFDGGYCGMSFVEGDRVNVCCLLEHRALEGASGSGWAKVVEVLGRRSAPLGRRLEDLEVDAAAPLRTSGEVAFVPREQAKDGVLFVGDAAGMIAPLAGDGQAMALDAGVTLAELIAGGGEPNALGARWSRLWRRRYGVRMGLAGALQRRLMRPAEAERLVRVVGSVPRLAGLLVRLTRG